MMGQDTQGWAFCPTGWAFCPHMGQDAHFKVKYQGRFISKILYILQRKISAYHEYDELLVMDQFPLVIAIWASNFRVGVLSHVSLLSFSVMHKQCVVSACCLAWWRTTDDVHEFLRRATVKPWQWYNTVSNCTVATKRIGQFNHENYPTVRKQGVHRFEMSIIYRYQ